MRSLSKIGRAPSLRHDLVAYIDGSIPLGDVLKKFIRIIWINTYRCETEGSNQPALHINNNQEFGFPGAHI